MTTLRRGKKTMKRLACIVAALCLVCASALAQPVAELTPLSGELYYPAGATAEEATYVFRYACPQFEGDSDAIQAVNTYFTSLAADLNDTPVPETVAELAVQPEQSEYGCYTQVDYRVTAATEDTLSVLLTSRQFLGITETESWTAVVFALTGVYAGQPVSLSQAMGLEQQDIGGGASYAATLVYGLVWQIIQQQQAMLQKDYYPGLTSADLESGFSPESDFYLDEDGNYVFFIQAGVIAGEVDGILTYPFSTAELLSAVNP